MARREERREDLMSEATALVVRAELVLPGVDAPIVIGMRRSGPLSVFIDQDPAYHFNAEGELRRAYVAGQLVKAEHGQLVSMRRVRSSSEVVLQAESLTRDATEELLQEVQQWLAKLAVNLQVAIDGRTAGIVRHNPASNETLRQLAASVTSIPFPVRVAQQAGLAH